KATAFSCTFTFGIDPAPVHFNEGLGDGEPHTQTAESSRTRRIGLSKTLEDVREKIRINPLTRIGDLHEDMAVRSFEADTNLSSCRGELHGIRQQIPNDLVKAMPVNPDGTKVLFQIPSHLQAFGCGRRKDGVDRLFDDRSGIQKLEVHRQLSRNDAGNVQQIVDELNLSGKISIDDFERLTLLRRSQFAAFQHLDPASNRSKR